MAKVWDVIGKRFLEHDDPIIVARQAAKDKRDAEFEVAKAAFHKAVGDLHIMMWGQDDTVLDNWSRSSMFRSRAQEILNERRKGCFKRVNNIDIDVKDNA